MNRITAAIAFGLLAIFLYILASKIGSLDLWVVTLLTLALAGYDFLTSSKNKN